MNNHPVDTWFVAKALNDTARLDDLLSEDARFFSPLHDIPQIGKHAAKLNIAGIMKLLAEAEHRYVRQVIGPHDAMLEFESERDGLKLNGVEILKWDDDCKITEVRVMLRPLDAAIIARDRMERLLLARKSKSDA
jgi:hypothetical protein